MVGNTGKPHGRTRTRIMIGAAAIALATAATAPLHAQSLGDSLRVTTRDETMIVQFVRAGPDSLHVIALEEGLAISLPWGDVDRLEHNPHNVRLWKEGLIFGAAIGVLGEAYVFFSDDESPPGSLFLFGTVFGLGFGVWLEDERWDRIETPGSDPVLEPLVGLRLGRESGPAALLGVRLRF